MLPLNGIFLAIEHTKKKESFAIPSKKKMKEK